MVSRKRIQNDSESGINEKLDKLAENIKKLPDKRKKMLEDLMKEKRLYDSLEACEILGIALPTLRRSIKLGRIKTVYVGRLLRIPSEEIARLMQGEESFLNSEEAGKLLKVTTETVRKLINAGKIKAVRLTATGPFKIPKSEIDRITTEGI